MRDTVCKPAATRGHGQTELKCFVETRNPDRGLKNPRHVRLYRVLSRPSIGSGRGGAVAGGGWRGREGEGREPRARRSTAGALRGTRATALIYPY